MVIEDLKQKLNLPQLMEMLGYGEYAKPSVSSPFREDKNPSWGIKEHQGKWMFKDFGTGESGDEIDFIQKALNLDQKDALAKYKELAGVEECKIILPTGPIQRMDWTAAREAFKPAHKNRLCEWRGLSPEFVDWLHKKNLVGVVQGQLAFPVQHNPRTTPNGKADGAHCFSRDKGWRILGGKSAPWWIGDHDEYVFVFESQWDAFAFMDKTKWAETTRAVSSIVITRGAQGGHRLKGLLPAKSKVYLFTQNDPIEDDTSPALKWQDDITSLHPRCYLVETPEEYKDVNEWTQGEGTGRDLLAAMEAATLYENPDLLSLPTRYMDWQTLRAFDPKDDTDCMLGSRWLSRGGSCVWIGSSGLGKSVLTLQAAMTWAVGMPFFGIQPKDHYRSLIVQAENNLGDVAETIQGVERGLSAEHPEIDLESVSERVSICHLVNSAGIEFIAQLKSMIAETQPDMVWIDPLLCYLGGDANSAEDVSSFTGHLDELAQETGCLFHLIHHTGKPKTSADTKGFTNADLMYAGLGSSVLTNWARAIMVLQAERGAEGIFRLTAAKRGKRAGLHHDYSERGEAVYLEHSQHGLCWLASEYEPPEKKGVGRPSFRQDMLKSWPEDGFTQKEAMDHFSQIHNDGIGKCPTAGTIKQAILHYAKDGSLERRDGKIYRNYGGNK